MNPTASGAYPLRHEASASIAAAPETVFDFIDDPLALASHMEQSSWRMGGGRMTTTLDEGLGRRVGSHVRMAGTMMGLRLELDEVVREHERPRRKTWETVGTPRLIVIDHYRMGFELSPRGAGSSLLVFIDYRLPASGWPRLLGALLGAWYARWCVERMLDDTKRHFGGERT